MAGTSAAEIDPSTSSVATAANMEELLPSTFSSGVVATVEMEEPLLRNERNVPSSFSCSKSLVIFLFFIAYMSVGALFYRTNSHDFSGVQSNSIVDGFYFSIVTFHTVGYGDIVPITPATKVFYCIFVLIAVGPVSIIISDAIDYIVDIMLDYIADRIVGACCIIGDMELMKMCVKVACAIGLLLICIGLGVLALHIMEDLDWMNSVYLSVISMTTVGYGDMFFKTMAGRIFAFLWLMLIPIATKLIMFLGNAFIDTCRWIANRVLI